MLIIHPISMSKLSNWTNLHAKLHRTLLSRQLLESGEQILVAVSGGQDSLCLLRLLGDLQRKWGWNLAIAHCDHQWQFDVGIAAHVEEIAQNWGMTFYLKTAEQPLEQTEAAARSWRYQALIKIAEEQGYSTIVTGHTKSDRAETLLYNLIRGAGANGLQALTWKRSLTDTIQLVRPMLEITRAETGQFCKEFQIPVWEDAYNSDLKYARNRIRQELLPYLHQFNPNVETAIAQTAELLRADVDYLEQQAELLRNQATGELGLNRLILRQAPLALQRRVMRQFLSLHLPSAPNFEQIEELIALIHAPNRSQTSHLPGKAIAQVKDNWIILVINN